MRKREGVCAVRFKGRERTIEAHVHVNLCVCVCVSNRVREMSSECVNIRASKALVGRGFG